MKKFLSGFLLAIICISCTSELQEESLDTKGTVICAHLSPVGKASVGETGKVSWEEGDEIGVFVDGKIVKFTLDEGEETPDGTFSSELYISGRSFDGVAVYPYDESLTLEDGKVTVRLHSESERGKALPAPMAASLQENGSYMFRNVASLLRIQYENLPSMAEKVRCTASSSICGLFSLPTDGTASITVTSATTDNVVTAYLPVVRPDNSAYVDIPMPEGTLSEIKAELLDVNDKVIDTRTTTGKTFIASVIKPMEAVTLPGERLNVEWIWDKGNLPTFRGSFPAIDDNGNVYVTSNEGTVYKIDSSGELVWSAALDGIGKNVGTSPSVEPDGSAIYFAGGQNGEGSLYALDGSGAVKWMFSDYPWDGINKKRNYWQTVIGVGQDNIYVPIGSLCALVAVNKTDGSLTGYGCGTADGGQGNMPGAGSGCAIGRSGTVSMLAKSGAFNWNKSLLDYPAEGGKFAPYGYHDLYDGWGDYSSDNQGVIAASYLTSGENIIISCSQESKGRIDVQYYPAAYAKDNTLKRHNTSDLAYYSRHQIGTNTNDSKAPAMQDQGGIVMGHDNTVVIVPMKYRSGASADDKIGNGGLYSVWIGRSNANNASACWRVNTGKENVSGAAAVDNNGNVHFATDKYYYIIKPNTNSGGSYEVLEQVHLRNLLAGTGLIDDFDYTGCWSSVKIDKNGKTYLNLNIDSKRGITCCFSYPGVTGPDETSSWPQKGADQYNSCNQQK